MTIQANQGFGVSIFGATSAGGGGSTSPGGSSGQLQYNASGSFGGMAGTSWDDTNRALTLTGATVTTSQPVLNLSQTWNAGAVTFTGLKFNATDTASAAGSLLLDLQTGSSSRISVAKDGVTTINGVAASFLNTLNVRNTIGGTNILNFTFGSNGTRFALGTTTNHNMALFTNNGVDSLTVTTAGAIQFRSTALVAWTSTDDASGTRDTILARDAANTLALRNGANAQTYRIYATADGSPGSNFQRLVLSAGVTANMAVVAADNGGTGIAMGLQFGAALTTGGGVTNIMNINTSGHLVWNTDNTYDIGTVTNRPRNIYTASDIQCGGGVQVASTNFYNFATRGTMGASANGVFLFRNAAATDFDRLQFGGVTSSFPALKRSSATLQVRLADDSAFAQLTASSLLAAGSTGVVGYSTGAGGAVTQATSRTTGVTLNKGCGQITLVSAAGTTSWQSFTVSNTTVAATDTIIVNQDSGTDLYQIFVTNVAANSFQITFATTGGTTTEQPVFSFAVIKAVAA